MYFEALYYDGLTSKGHKANIQLLSDGIKINFEDQQIIKRIVDFNAKESAFNKGNTILYFGQQFPYSAIEINGNDFQVFFQRQFPDIFLKQNKVSFLENTGTKAILLLIVAVIGFLLLAYFFIIPAGAEKAAEYLPRQYEIDLGDQLFEQMSQSMQVDSVQSDLANQFFKSLNYPATYPVKITVVNSPISNAFALPGGHIVVYDEMFKIMKSKSEFAALLSHEYAHVTERHTTRSLFRGLATYLVISLVMSDVNGLMAVVLQNADNLKSLSYSRSLEQEADDVGFDYLQSAQQDPQGMIDLFKHLGKANKVSQEIPEFLSSHPMLESRMDAIKKKVASNKQIQVEHPQQQDIWNKIKAMN